MKVQRLEMATNVQIEIVLAKDRHSFIEHALQRDFYLRFPLFFPLTCCGYLRWPNGMLYKLNSQSFTLSYQILPNVLSTCSFCPERAGRMYAESVGRCP